MVSTTRQPPRSGQMGTIAHVLDGWAELDRDLSFIMNRLDKSPHGIVADVKGDVALHTINNQCQVGGLFISVVLGDHSHIDNWFPPNSVNETPGV
jgi:hypothetical protein